MCRLIRLTYSCYHTTSPSPTFPPSPSSPVLPIDSTTRTSNCQLHVIRIEYFHHPNCTRPEIEEITTPLRCLRHGGGDEALSVFVDLCEEYGEQRERTLERYQQVMERLEEEAQQWWSISDMLIFLCILGVVLAVRDSTVGPLRGEWLGLPDVYEASRPLELSHLYLDGQMPLD